MDRYNRITFERRENRPGILRKDLGRILLCFDFAVLRHAEFALQPDDRFRTVFRGLPPAEVNTQGSHFFSFIKTDIVEDKYFEKIANFGLESDNMSLGANR